MTTRASALDGEDGDRELVAAYLKSRGEEAFRALYRRHTRRLYGPGAAAARRRGARRRGGRAGGLDPRRPEARRLRLALEPGDLARRHRDPRLPRSRLRPVPLESAGAAEPAVAAAGDGRVDLERAIAALPERCREVLVLHDVEGYTHREISGFLGIEIGTSKSHLFQARRAMRARLGRESEREP